MISTVSTIVPSYRKLKICNFFACCLEWKNKNLTKRILFIYLLASSFASWNMACCVSTTASGLSDAGARVVLPVLRRVRVLPVFEQNKERNKLFGLLCGVG